MLHVYCTKQSRHPYHPCRCLMSPYRRCSLRERSARAAQCSRHQWCTHVEVPAAWVARMEANYKLKWISWMCLLLSSYCFKVWHMIISIFVRKRSRTAWIQFIRIAYGHIKNAILHDTIWLFSIHRGVLFPFLGINRLYCTDEGYLTCFEFLLPIYRIGWFPLEVLWDN